MKLTPTEQNKQIGLFRKRMCGDRIGSTTHGFINCVALSFNHNYSHLVGVKLLQARSRETCMSQCL